MTPNNVEKVVKIFTDYCDKKRYQCVSVPETLATRLDISNLRDKTIVKIYNTLKVVVQGQENLLKQEVLELKAQFESNPTLFVSEAKASSARYDILLVELRARIKESLVEVGTISEVIENPRTDTEYRLKIDKEGSALTVTQFSNGTLLLQGKDESLFNETCDLIERVANPAEKDVVARFISSDEKSLELFTARYTPQLIIDAENVVKERIGEAYDYLKEHDRKWFVASACLCLTKIPLPEFSALVMPASKAFEGFCKTLLVGIGLHDVDHFNKKDAKFDVLNDKNHPRRVSACEKERYVDSYLKRLSTSLDMHRNFMMHSNESDVTKVNSLEEAEKKVEKIFEEVKEFFDYFNKNFSLVV